MSERYDIAILGAGPGGYVAAIRAAQLGKKTVLIDKSPTLGGTCLNVGCIPSKALLDTSEHYHFARTGASDHGIGISDVSLDLEKVMKRKQGVVDQLTGGVATLIKKNGIDVVTGTGRLMAPRKIAVGTGEGEVIIESNNVILATGSVPQELPFLRFDGDRIVDSTGALSFQDIPGHLLVVGAGAIGLELGSVWARFGAQVTVIEIMDSILPGWDLQIARTLQRSLKQLGMDVRTSTKVTGFEKTGDGVNLPVEAGNGKTEVLAGDRVLVAAGRKPAIGDELAGLGIEIESGRIRVDGFQTTVPGVYAIGDLIHGPMLAHKAEEDGIQCVEAIAGLPVHTSYDLVPGVVYTWPEAAAVGLTEEQLKAQKREYVKGSFPFRVNGRALASGDTDGFVKILADPDTDAILGAHILGPHASALIAEIVAIMAMGGNAEDIASIIHAHPTLPEAIKEAGLSAIGRPIHSI